jgi:hypothetical protein
MKEETLEELRRTNRVNLSLNDKEHASLVLYAENIGKPISIAVREIIDTMVDVAKVYDSIKTSYSELDKKYKDELEKQFKEGLSKTPIESQIEFYSYIKKMDELSKFAKNWEKKKIKKVRVTDK